MEALDGGSISLACEDTCEMHVADRRKTNIWVLGNVLGWGSRELMTEDERIHLCGICNMAN